MAGGVILGIDPGLKGAIAFLRGSEVITYMMPVLKAKRGQMLDEGTLARMIDANSRDIEFAVLEAQWARPTDGGPQAFKTGMNFGSLRMVLAANFIPYQIISPVRWKRFLGVTSDKDSSRALANQLFPRSADQWRLRTHEGRAEAALLAHYGVKHPIRAESEDAQAEGC